MVSRGGDVVRTPRWSQRLFYTAEVQPKKFYVDMLELTSWHWYWLNWCHQLHSHFYPALLLTATLLQGLRQNSNIYGGCRRTKQQG
jgi:hypothetical protein